MYNYLILHLLYLIFKSCGHDTAIHVVLELPSWAAVALHRSQDNFCIWLQITCIVKCWGEFWPNSPKFGCFGPLSPSRVFSLDVFSRHGRFWWKFMPHLCRWSPGLANSPDFPVVQPASCSRRIWTLLEVLKAKVGPSLRKPLQPLVQEEAPGLPKCLLDRAKPSFLDEGQTCWRWCWPYPVHVAMPLCNVARMQGGIAHHQRTALFHDVCSRLLWPMETRPTTLPSRLPSLEGGCPTLMKNQKCTADLCHQDEKEQPFCAREYNKESCHKHRNVATCTSPCWLFSRLLNVSQKASANLEEDWSPHLAPVLPNLRVSSFESAEICSTEIGTPYFVAADPRMHQIEEPGR